MAEVGSFCWFLFCPCFCMLGISIQCPGNMFFNCSLKTPGKKVMQCYKHMGRISTWKPMSFLLYFLFFTLSYVFFVCLYIVLCRLHNILQLLLSGMDLHSFLRDNSFGPNPLPQQGSGQFVELPKYYSFTETDFISSSAKVLDWMGKTRGKCLVIFLSYTVF